jgi:hypothetical protein
MHSTDVHPWRTVPSLVGVGWVGLSPRRSKVVVCPFIAQKTNDTEWVGKEGQNLR